MARFFPRHDGQTTLVCVSFDDHVIPGTIEYAIHYLIEHKLDLAMFAEDFCNDKTGRPGYDPAILLKVVLYAYYKGITSSRDISECCARHVTFMVLASHTLPHWTTIARFVSGHADAIADIFAQVLMVCDQQGLLGHQLVAIDGCKMSSNAAKEWSGTIEELTRKRDKIRARMADCVARHQALDASGSEDLAEREAQTVRTLSAAADKLDAFLATAAPRPGMGQQRSEVKSNITDNDSATMHTSKGTVQGYTGVAAVDSKHQVIVDAQAFGSGQEQHALQTMLKAVDETYEALGQPPLSSGQVVITADTGYASEDNNRYLNEHGINGYIPDNQFRQRDPRYQDKAAHHGRQHPAKYPKTIDAAAFAFDPVNMTCCCPGDQSLRFSHRGVDRHGNEKAFFKGDGATCQSCPLRDGCLRNAASTRGRQVSFQVGEKPKYTDWMKHRVDSEQGKRYYSERMQVVEPVFGNIGHNKGLKRFGLRGRRKVNTQWQLYCLVHNIEKLHGYGQLVA